MKASVLKPNMESELNELVTRLKKAHGDSLVSVILYGSAVTGDHQKEFSDLNILSVLSEVTPRELADAQTVFTWWNEQGNPAPLLLSEHELATSTDCFAIEFHDIQHRHELLFGKDVITPLVIDDSFYRAQVEHELRAKLLRLRTKAAAVLSEKDALRRLLVDSVSTFCILFRHALLLHGVTVEPKNRGAIESARIKFEIDALPFTQLLDVREQIAKPKDIDPEPLLGSYLREISRVVDHVDRLAK